MSGNFFRKFNRLRILFWLVVVAGGCVLLGLRVQARLKEAAANVASLEQAEEVRYAVTSSPVASSVWESWRSYYGRTKAARTQDVTTYVREVVQTVHVQVGDRVKVGDTVVTLLKADHVARAQAGRTGYEEALMNYNRLLELSKKGGVSRSEVDRAYALMKSEEANAQSSRSTLQRTDLKASIDGVVSSRTVEPGEVAEVGKSLITIVDLSEMEVELLVSKKDIHHIARETPVELMVDGDVSRGWVKRSSPEAQTGSGLYPVVVGLNADSGILPGTYLEGRFLIDRKNEVVVISSDIVMFRGEKEFVYLADGEKARMTEIKTGEGRNGRVIVTAGLKVGDALIVSGNRALFDGASISQAAVAENKKP